MPQRVNPDPPEPNRYGEFARLVCRARADCHLSLSEIARRTGLSRSTLHRWETGKNLAWLPELEKFLAATAASESLRRSLIRSVNRPRAIRNVSEFADGQFGANNLVQALRLRAGISTTDLAGLIGVTVSAVRQWERGESFPSTDHLHRLCFHVGAAPEELLALEQGPFVPEMEAKDLIESVEWRLAHRQNPLPASGSDPLLDLKVACLENLLVDLIRHGNQPEKNLTVLGYIRASYAQVLQTWGRNELAIQMCRRVLRQPHPGGYTEYTVRAQVIHAQLMANSRRYRAEQSRILIGLEPTVAERRPGRYYSFQPWIWATLADLFANARRYEPAMEAIDRAGEIERYYHAQQSTEVLRWKAKLLNQFGKADRAESLALEGIELATKRREPTLPGLWIELARSYELTGRGQMSIDTLLEAQKLALKHSAEHLLPGIAQRVASLQTVPTFSDF